jgi:RNA polymerase sigma-70 factor (ECF subfamily)
MGDRQAFAELVDRYEKPVFNIALRMVHDRNDACDVTQTVFSKTLENLRNFSSRHRFFSWIYRIAINESLNLLQNRKRQPLPLLEVQDQGMSPEEKAQAGELRKIVRRTLMGIKTEQRAVLILRHYLNLSYREIGKVLDIPEKTVKSRLYSARQQMKCVLFMKNKRS